MYRVGIEKYFSPEFYEDIFLTGSGELRDIFEIDVGKSVQTGHQCDVNVIGLFDLFGLERYRMVENIGFTKFTVDISFQTQNLIASGIHLDKINIAGRIQLSVAFREVVI